MGQTIALSNDTQLLKEQLTQHQNEKAQLQQENKQLQVSVKSLEVEIATISKEKTSLQTNQQEMMAKNKMLEREKQQLENDKQQLEIRQHQLQEQHQSVRNQVTQLEKEKDEIESELQGQIARLSIENMRLNGRMKQLESDSVSDIKYWEVSCRSIKTNGVVLGEGGWGKVLVGLFQGQKVALKMLHSEIVSPYYNQLVRREICMMAKVRHPNLLLFVAAVLDHPSGSPIIITELLDTSLRKAYKDGLVSDNSVKLNVMRDVASALCYLHCHKDVIIHRDVSSANVLLEAKGTGKWKAKLSDFGSANLVQFSMTTGPGAQVYAAPEVPQNQTPKMDVYSYGILLCEVMTCQFPFPQTFPTMLHSLARDWMPLYQLIVSCTKHLPTERPSMEYVLQTLYDNFSGNLMSDFNSFVAIV